MHEFDGPILRKVNLEKQTVVRDEPAASDERGPTLTATREELAATREALAKMRTDALEKASNERKEQLPKFDERENLHRDPEELS